eukprot:augustus_masked-scaffold_4-processed-gene-17.4-mRNA-1 protein AED:1.00 eAED:1.00 QI:0/-1/0/0/-1/1/1/0/508
MESYKIKATAVNPLPFTFLLAKLQNGYNLEDMSQYSGYVKYLTMKLKKLNKFGKRNNTEVSFFAELLRCERAYSTAQSIKHTLSEAEQIVNGKLQQRLIARSKKATAHCDKLLRLGKGEFTNSVDSEIKLYVSFLAGNLALEKQDFKVGLEIFLLCKNLVDQLLKVECSIPVNKYLGSKKEFIEYSIVYCQRYCENAEKIQEEFLKGIKEGERELVMGLEDMDEKLLVSFNNERFQILNSEEFTSKKISLLRSTLEEVTTESDSLTDLKVNFEAYMENNFSNITTQKELRAIKPFSVSLKEHEDVKNRLTSLTKAFVSAKNVEDYYKTENHLNKTGLEKLLLALDAAKKEFQMIIHFSRLQLHRGANKKTLSLLGQILKTQVNFNKKIFMTLLVIRVCFGAQMLLQQNQPEKAASLLFAAEKDGLDSSYGLLRKQKVIVAIYLANKDKPKLGLEKVQDEIKLTKLPAKPFVMDVAYDLMDPKRMISEKEEVTTRGEDSKKEKKWFGIW